MKTSNSIKIGVLLLAGGGLMGALLGGRAESSRPDPLASEQVAPDGDPASVQPLGASKVRAPEAVVPGSRFTHGADAYLAELRRLYEIDKAQALAWGQAGEGRFHADHPAEPARRALMITALVELERMAEARSLVRKFNEKYPDSEYGPIVRGVTGIHPRPGPPPEYQ